MLLRGEKRIPLCVPRPPNCGGKEKARDRVRDDTVSARPQMVRRYECRTDGETEGKSKMPASSRKPWDEAAATKSNATA